MHINELFEPRIYVSSRSAVIYFVVGVCGVVAASLLARFMPVFVKLPTPTELKETNHQLLKEISERRIAEENLRNIKASLETIVQMRTQELTVLTHRLRQEEETVSLLNEDLNRRLLELQTLLEVAPIGIVVTHDPNCEKFKINPFCAKLMGVPEDTRELDRSSLFTEGSRRIHIYKNGVEIPDQEMPMIRALKENRDIIEHEMKVVHPDGKEIEVIEYAILLRDHSQKIQGVLGLFVDITERKQERRQIESELRKAKLDADRANESKTCFLANISHEMRTPLGIIMGFADIALNESNSPESRGQALETVKRNAQQLSVLVSDVLDVSKVEAGRLEIEYMSFNLEEFIKEIQAMIAPQANTKKLAFVVNMHGLLPSEVVSDANRLKQILINLIGNAIKFTESGKIELNISAETSGQLHDPVILKIAVRDTGIGITREQLPRLFHPFSQGDASMSRRFGGTGLGLMLSKSLAKALDGDLILKWSEPAKGTEFVVTVDAGCYHPSNMHTIERKSSDISAIGMEPRQHLVESDLHGRHILLVDDAEDNLTLVSHYLLAAGAKVECANDGVEAISKVENNSFDLVLMDIQMPRMDGYHATKQIRGLGFQIPIVAVTAHALKGDRERYMAAGFDDYLTKPLRQDQLLQIVRKIVKNTYDQTLRHERHVLT